MTGSPGMNRSAAHAAPLPTGAPSRILRKDIAMNRFPLKHLADAAALAKVLVLGDVIHGRPLALAKRLDCLRFYFQADGVFRLHAALLRSGALWSQMLTCETARNRPVFRVAGACRGRT